MDISMDIRDMKLNTGHKGLLPPVNEVWEHGMKLAGAGELNG